LPKISRITEIAQRQKDAEDKLAECLTVRFNKAISDTLDGQKRDTALTVLQASITAIAATMLEYVSFDQRQLWIGRLVERLREVNTPKAR
jgi:hypothetical protein